MLLGSDDTRAREHAEVQGTDADAWRARALNGALLLELTAMPPPAADQAMATVHVHPCGE